RVLALRIFRATEKPTVLRPALHQLAFAAGVALLARRLRLRVPALAFLRRLELLTETLVEAREEHLALFVAGLDLVELFFHVRRERRIHEIELALHEPVDDVRAERRRLEARVDLLDVVARLHLADDLGVRARAPDAALLKLAHERAFVEARRRLRELLLGDDAGRRDEHERLAFAELGQRRRIVVLFFAVVLFDDVAVDREPPGELQDAPARAQRVVAGL